MSHRIIAIGAVGLAALYFWGIASIRVPQLDDALGPRSFPILIGVGLLVAAAMLVFESRPSAAQKQKSPAISEEHRFGVVAAVAAATAAYFLAFEPLGYLLSTFAFLSALILSFYRGSRILALCSSAGFAVVTYVCFNRLLGARLPGGILPL